MTEPSTYGSWGQWTERVDKMGGYNYGVYDGAELDEISDGLWFNVHRNMLELYAPTVAAEMNTYNPTLQEMAQRVADRDDMP